MYNSEWKSKFIAQYTASPNTAKQCERVFKLIEPYEQAWHADLCTRTAKELQPVVEAIAGMRSYSFYTRIIFLKKYVSWCIANGYPGAISGFDSLDYNSNNKWKDMTVSNPLQFQLFLNKIFDPEQSNTIDNTSRCYWWMAYGGIPEELLVDITADDVDFDSMSIHHGSADAQIYVESLPAFKHCINQTEFIYKNQNYHKDIIRSRIPGDILVRGIRSAPSTSVFRSELSRKIHKAADSGETIQRLSYNRIWISGLFYRMKQIEDAGLPVDFSQTAAEFMAGKTYRLDSNRTTLRNKQKQIAADYREDYERWKAAHF